jgi:hypothetical protein
MHATTVAIDLAKEVFQLAVADHSWRVVQTAHHWRRQYCTHTGRVACSEPPYMRRTKARYQKGLGHGPPKMAPRYITAPRTADNFSGSFACRFNDWQRSARRFHVGHSHSERITQAGNTTAGYFLSANTTIILLLLFVGSPYTSSYACRD